MRIYRKNEQTMVEFGNMALILDIWLDTVNSIHFHCILALPHLSRFGLWAAKTDNGLPQATPLDINTITHWGTQHICTPDSATTLKPIHSRIEAITIIGTL